MYIIPCYHGGLLLTHWGRDKMGTISQTTFSHTFPWMKMYEFRLRFVPKGPINNIPALFQVIAWRRPGDKPLSEPMMVILLTHVWVIRPQWVNSSHVQLELGMTLRSIITRALVKFQTYLKFEDCRKSPRKPRYRPLFWFHAITWTTFDLALAPRQYLNQFWSYFGTTPLPEPVLNLFWQHAITWTSFDLILAPRQYLNLFWSCFGPTPIPEPDFDLS